MRALKQQKSGAVPEHVGADERLSGWEDVTVKSALAILFFFLFFVNWLTTTTIGSVKPLKEFLLPELCGSAAAGSLYLYLSISAGAVRATVSCVAQTTQRASQPASQLLSELGRVKLVAEALSRCPGGWFLLCLLGAASYFYCLCLCLCLSGSLLSPLSLRFGGSHARRQNKSLIGYSRKYRGKLNVQLNVKNWKVHELSGRVGRIAYKRQEHATKS